MSPFGFEIRIFSLYDTLAEGYGIEKIKTIGDTYMVVCIRLTESGSEGAGV